VLIGRLEQTGLPFAPIARPEDLFEDPHLNAAHGLVRVTLPDGSVTTLPALPLELDGIRPGIRHDLPVLDAQRAQILRDYGVE